MTEAVLVTDMLGWKATDDGQHVLVGLRDDAGQEFALAIPVSRVTEFAFSFINATAVSPFDKRMGAKGEMRSPVEWFEIGRLLNSDDLSLSLVLPGGGHLSFRLTKAMAEQVLQTLQSALAPGSMDPTHGTRQH